MGWGVMGLCVFPLSSVPSLPKDLFCWVFKRFRFATSASYLFVWVFAYLKEMNWIFVSQVTMVYCHLANIPQMPYLASWTLETSGRDYLHLEHASRIRPGHKCPAADGRRASWSFLCLWPLPGVGAGRTTLASTLHGPTRPRRLTRMDVAPSRQALRPTTSRTRHTWRFLKHTFHSAHNVSH